MILRKTTGSCAPGCLKKDTLIVRLGSGISSSMCSVEWVLKDCLIPFNATVCLVIDGKLCRFGTRISFGNHGNGSQGLKSPEIIC